MDILNILEDENEIKNAQRMLGTALGKICDEEIPVSIGYKGGNTKVNVSYSQKYNIWFYLGQGPTRYWNAFGVDRPRNNASVSIIVEINPPLKGINKRVAGIFAKDNNGNIFLIHRGRIGGGRKGIGPALFNKHYNGEKTIVQEGKEISDRTVLPILGCITAPDFSERLARFIWKVRGIKDIA